MRQPPHRFCLAENPYNVSSLDHDRVRASSRIPGSLVSVVTRSIQTSEAATTSEEVTGRVARKKLPDSTASDPRDHLRLRVQEDRQQHAPGPASLESHLTAIAHFFPQHLFLLLRSQWVLNGRQDSLTELLGDKSGHVPIRLYELRAASLLQEANHVQGMTESQRITDCVFNR